MWYIVLIGYIFVTLMFSVAQYPQGIARVLIYLLRPLQKSLPFDSRNPNTGFRLFSPPITPNSTQIPP